MVDIISQLLAIHHPHNTCGTDQLAPALCEMNNFIAIKSGSFGLIGGEICRRREISSPDKKKKNGKDKNVSPDKVASSNVGKLKVVWQLTVT